MFLRNKKMASRIIVLISVFMLQFSVVSCETKTVSLSKIDKSSVVSAMQDVLGLQEFDAVDYDHYYIEDDYLTVYCSDLDDPGKKELHLTENLRAIDRSDDDSFVHVSYFVFTSVSEAEYYFHSQYCYIERQQARGDSSDTISDYTPGTSGYFIKTEKSEYEAVYFVDDMVITVTVSDLENVERAQEFLQTLGLPIQ